MKTQPSFVCSRHTAIKTNIVFAYAFFFFLNTTAFSQGLTLAGENYLLLNGERFKSQRLVFSKAEGDWYATAKDGHGTLTFFGTYDGRVLRFDMEWDGKKDAYPVNNENRHHVREAEFLLTASDKAVYGDGINAYPSGEDEVKIVVQHIDALSVSGDINGIITQGNKKVDVKGAFNLKRLAAPKNAVSASYKDCDNVVHDKLIGAQARTPSECEAKYDLDVRTTIHDALAPVLERFGSDWTVTKQTSLEPLTGVARGSEKNSFSTRYELVLQAAPTSAVVANYKKQFDAFSDKLKTASKETIAEFTRFGREMRGATNASISFSVNSHGGSFGNFKGGTKITKLSPTVYLVQSPYVQATTGGDENDAVDASFLLIGNWKPPVVEKLGEGEETVKVSAVPNPAASHLQAQNIFIRIESSAANAKVIVDNLNIKKLEALLAR